MGRTVQVAAVAVTSMAVVKMAESRPLRSLTGGLPALEPNAMVRVSASSVKAMVLANMLGAASAQGTSACYQLSMQDSWGDGWNGNTWHWVDASGGDTTGTLSSGSSGTAQLCATGSSCYNFYVDSSGSYTFEVSWSLQDTAGSTVASGGADNIQHQICPSGPAPAPSAGGWWKHEWVGESESAWHSWDPVCLCVCVCVCVWVCVYTLSPSLSPSLSHSLSHTPSCLSSSTNRVLLGIKRGNFLSFRRPGSEQQRLRKRSSIPCFCCRPDTWTQHADRIGRHLLRW